MKTADDSAVPHLLAQLCGIMTEIETRARALPRENSVLRRLYFDAMYSREDNISTAASGTFKWILGEQDVASSQSSISGSIVKGTPPRSKNEDETDTDSDSETEETLSTLEDENISNSRSLSTSETKQSFSSPGDEEHISQDSPPAYEDRVDESAIVHPDSPDLSLEVIMRQRVADSFLSFMEHDNGIFFISGKAGSGKSTLMKFLGDHDRVKALAESWAGDKTLVFAPFYFWNSGDRVQMSLEGFYRTVLFKILQKCPEMAATLFPQQFNAHHNDANFEGPFRIIELRSAMEALTKTAKFPSHRLCFFFDGMDEYEGDSLEHLHLARMFKSWASSSDIKIICSARPHEEFMKTFADSRGFVHLHELTRGDIHKFLISQLRKELVESGSENMLTEYASLVDEMVDMADGVFLWAFLVMRSILSGIAHEDRTQILRERIHSAPRELNDLFKKILNSVDPALQDRSRNLLLLATNDPFFNNIPAIAYYWLPDLQDKEFPFYLPIQPLSQEEEDKRLRIVRGQLSALTKGLLEIQPGNESDSYFKHTVGFLHRTVKDFLQSEHGWMRTSSGEDLLRTDQPELYLRLWLALEKFSPEQKLDRHSYKPFFWICDNPDYVIAPRILDGFSEIVDVANAAFKTFMAQPTTDTPAVPRKAENFLTTYSGLRMRVFRKRFQLGSMKQSDGYSSGGFYRKEAATSSIRCYITYNQCSYVMSKLQSKPILEKYRAELPLFLLIKTTDLQPNFQFCKAMFDFGVVPSDEIALVDKSPKPIWLVFLRVFLYDIFQGPNYPETQAGESLIAIWQILEEFLLRGADADVIFVLREHRLDTLRPGTPSPPPTPPSDPLGPLSLTVTTPEAIEVPGSKAPDDTPLPPREESPAYYLELEQLVDALNPANATSLRKLLSKRTATRFWTKTSGLVSKLGLWGNSASSSIRDKYPPMEIEWLSTRPWMLESVVTKTNELAGDFLYDIF